MFVVPKMHFSLYQEQDGSKKPWAKFIEETERKKTVWIAENLVYPIAVDNSFLTEF